MGLKEFWDSEDAKGYEELLVYGNVFFHMTLDGIRRVPRAEWVELAAALRQMTEQQDD